MTYFHLRNRYLENCFSFFICQYNKNGNQCCFKTKEHYSKYLFGCTVLLRAWLFCKSILLWNIAFSRKLWLYSFQVGSKTDCHMCFGPMVPDGYGVCYNPMDDHINFAVTAFNSCEETNATKLSKFLEDALLDMKTLLEQVSKAQWVTTLL